MSHGSEAGAVRNRNRRIATLAVIALAGTALLVALFVLQVRSEIRRDAAIAAQAQSYERVIRAAALSASIAQAEATLGRYVISDDRAMGQRFGDAWNQARDQLDRLATLSRGDPAESARIAQVREAFHERGTELSETASYLAHRRGSDALGSYYAIRSSAALTRLNQGLEQLLERQRTRLLRSNREAVAAIDRASTATRALAAFGLLLALGAVLLGWFMVEVLGERGEADAEAVAERVRSAELEEAVAAATAQLRAEAREREETEARLRQVQKMEAVGQLTGGIAHDFNNMLAVVVGGLELARRQLDHDESPAKRHIENAMEGANRAAALTRRLLTFSRSEPLLPEAVEPGALIRGMADLLDRTLGDAVSVETHDAGSGWCVWVDRHQLENAVLNLAVNARDAMEGRGTLTIATAGATLAAGAIGSCAAGDYASIAVSDTGCGMTPEVLERVFEPFFTTKPVGQGTGLGLSQIFGFARRSGGEIGIETKPGRGTTVTLYLPRYFGTATPATPESAVDPVAAARPLDILVVEDDPRVLAATVEALSELGHRAIGCDNPIEAPARLAEMAALDLIVSDVLMPDRTGPEMIAALEAEGRLDGAAVLFVTGYAGETDPAVFGGRPVLRKPYTMATLARAVEEAVPSTRGSRRRFAHG